MKTLTHFLDTPKRSEISALLKPLPISSTTCDSRGLNNIGRSSPNGFSFATPSRHVRKPILAETVSNMQYREIVADKLSAVVWSWGYCSLLQTRHSELQSIIGNYGSSALHTTYVRYPASSNDKLPSALSLKPTLLEVF